MQDDTPISLARSAVLYNYAGATSLTVLFFDMALTFSTEVDYIWRKPLSTSSVVFFLNRCQNIHIFQQVYFFVSQILVVLVLCMRIYALYGCTRKVAALLVCVVIIATGLCTWSVVATEGAHTVYFFGGCRDPYSTMDAPKAMYAALPWEAMFVVESVIFFLTARKSPNFGRELRPISGRMSLTAVMLRDGSAYFAAMASVTLAQILTVYLAPSAMTGFLSTFSNCLAVTLISRLMLNLHETAHAGLLTTNVPSTGTTNHTPVQFPESSLALVQLNF
ncbi:hypothetical protein PLICRDRAFT_534452 [Plicaturopsis crispa FD-325 SS-3]|nr:hypothetical protein PLICRDRAFT_534452 [Plicaturopsis crispa FD-325 SS-3]